MQILVMLSAPPIFNFPTLLHHQGADIRTERLRSKPMSGLNGLGRGPDANYCAFFSTLIFYFLALLDYQGADIRTERFRSKLMFASKGLGRGPNANYHVLFGTFIF